MAGTNGHSTAEAVPEKRLTFPTGEEFTLPFSGVTVLIRRTSLLGLMRHGLQFGTLQAAAVKLTESGGDGNALLSDPDGQAAYARLLDAVTRRMLMRPRVVDRAEDVKDPERQVWIDDIDDEDKQALFLWNQGAGDAEAEEVADDALAFPDDAGGAASGLQPVRDGHGDGAAAE